MWLYWFIGMTVLAVYVGLINLLKGGEK